MKRESTIKEALEQGYTLCGKNKHGWQALTQINDMSEIDFEDEEWFLAEKEGEAPTVSEEFIKDILADRIADDDAWDTGRDDEEVYNAVMALDFSSTSEMINKALEEYKSYKLTDIKLKFSDR